MSKPDNIITPRHVRERREAREREQQRSDIASARQKERREAAAQRTENPDPALKEVEDGNS